MGQTDEHKCSYGRKHVIFLWEKKVLVSVPYYHLVFIRDMTMV